MNQHPYLAIGQEVVFTTSDKEPHTGKITAVYDDNSARVEWEDGIGIGPCSDRDIPGTFQFKPSEAEAKEDELGNTQPTNPASHEATQD